MSKKALKGQRLALFEYLINQFHFVNIKLLAEALEIDPKTCIRYYEQLNEDVQGGISANRKLGSEHSNDWIEYRSIKHYPSGYMRGFNQEKSRVVHFSMKDIHSILNMEQIDNVEKTKLKEKLFVLLAGHIYKSAEYKNTLQVIEASITEKKKMKIKRGYYVFGNKQKELKDTEFSPVYVDAENDILYAITGDDKHGFSSLININIFTLEGCSVSGKDFTYYESWEDIPYDIDAEKKYIRDREAVAIDILGNIKKGADEIIYKVVLQLDHIAKARLLKKSIRFYSHIKKNDNPAFPFKLTLTVFDINEIAGFIVANFAHVKILGTLKFKEQLKKYLQKLVYSEELEGPQK